MWKGHTDSHSHSELQEQIFRPYLRVFQLTDSSSTWIRFCTYLGPTVSVFPYGLITSLPLSLFISDPLCCACHNFSMSVIILILAPELLYSWRISDLAFVIRYHLACLVHFIFNSIMTFLFVANRFCAFSICPLYMVLIRNSTVICFY